MLETIWFILWGVLWAVYFTLDGFDLGIGALAPFLAKDDRERRIMYNAMGPLWNGNEVWLITAGGVTFAAFPGTYAVMFSALYTPLMLILFALILRGVAFEFRGKEDFPGWRATWDACLFIGSALPALLFGVAFANIFQGIPLDAKGIFQGNLFTLLNPYGLAGGVLFVMLFLHHGALWLAVKTPNSNPLHDRARGFAAKIWLPLLIVAAAFLVWTAFATKLYDNYLDMPLFFVVPLLSVAGLLGARMYSGQGQTWKAWGSSGLTILTCTLFGVTGLYPNLLPSSLDPKFSLTAFNSSSTPLTLQIMLGVALVMVPIVIGYQTWAYKFFSHKITQEDLDYEEAY